MARPEFEEIIEMTPQTRRDLMRMIGTLEGMYEVTIKPKRDTRSLRANAYYWACVLKPFHEFLRDQEPTVTHRDQSHAELKRQLLGTVPIIRPGATFRPIRTTHDMDTCAFADFVDRARVFLSQQVGIETADPDPTYWIQPTSRVPETVAGGL